jgi:hypothetical protein
LAVISSVLLALGPSEKDKKRKDRRYDGQTRRTDDTTTKREGQKEEGQTIRRQSEKDRRYDGQTRRTDDTTAKREGQKEEGQTIRRPSEKDKKRKDRRYDGQTRRTDDTTTKREGQKEDGQTIRRQSEKDKKRKDRRYDDKVVSSVLPLFVLSVWPSYRLSFLFLSFSFGRRIVCPSSIDCFGIVRLFLQYLETVKR